MGVGSFSPCQTAQSLGPPGFRDVPVPDSGRLRADGAHWLRLRIQSQGGRFQSSCHAAGSFSDLPKEP